MAKEKHKNKTTATSSGVTAISKWLPLLIFLFSFFIYSNTLQHEYAQDDDIYTRKNSFIQKGISSFPELVKQGSLVGFDSTNVSDYRPLVLINFALEKSLFGNSPKANHFFNVVFYALICMLLFMFLRKLFSAYPTYVPILITLLFLLHPIHTEVVANIKSRDELLCFLFGLMSLHFIYKYESSHYIKHAMWSCISFFLCLLCKENGFTFLGLIPLLLYFFTPATFKRIVLLSLPFVAIAGLNLIIRMAVLDSLMLTKSLVLMDNSLIAATNFSDQLATNFTMLLKAFTLLFFPITLSYDYSFNEFPIVSWSSMEALLSLLLYLGLGAIAILGLKKKSIFSFAILFYLISYSLTSNLFFKIGSSFAERFLFAPSLAFCIAFPFLLAFVLKLDLKKVSANNASKLIGTCLVLCLLFSFKTISRNAVWKNNSTLFASGIETAPNSARVHFAYANEFREKVEGSADMFVKQEAAKSAIASYQKGLAIYNKDERIYYNMGVVYYNINEIDKASEVYEKALKIKPNYPEALNNMGVIYFNKKEYATAQSYFKRAIQSNSNYTDAYANLGASYHNMGDPRSAIPYFEKAMALSPSNGIFNNLSMAYGAIGDTAKANYYAAQAKLY